MLAWVRDATDPLTRSNNICALGFVHVNCTELLLGLIRTNVKIFVRTSQHLRPEDKKRGWHSSRLFWFSSGAAGLAHHRFPAGARGGWWAPRSRGPGSRRRPHRGPGAGR